MPQVILVVDDDPAQRRILEELVRNDGYQVMTADSGKVAIDLISNWQNNGIGLVILDLVMPDIDGMGVLEYLNANKLSVPVIVQTAQGGVDTAVKAMGAGASDFISKPVNPERLKISIRNLLKVNILSSEIKKMRNYVDGCLTFDDLVVSSPVMANVIKLSERAAQSDIPVLIEGESGVGKEVIARVIQGAGPRKGKSFVTVNCGAIPENLFESILFGHEKGSFTGAENKHLGKFVEANGGTIFLDEVGEIPLEMQVKLLRVLQEGEVDPIGSKEPVKVDVRVISATNSNMIDLVNEGSFREDLYYRLNVFPIMIPSLRERIDDIPGLAEHFAAKFAIEEGKKINGLTNQAIELLQHYNWPGNIRQLENAVFRAVVLCDGNVLGIEEFPQISSYVDGAEIAIPQLISTGTGGRDGYSYAGQGNNRYRTSIGGSNIVPINRSMTDTHSNEQVLGVTAITDGGHIRPLDDIEADMIRLAIQRYRGHMSEVARKLGIGRSTLYRKVKEMGIDAKM